MQHRAWEDPSSSSRGIEIAGWEITTRKKAILNAAEIDEASARLAIPLPEITFGNNLVELRKRNKDKGKGKGRATSISFNGLDALALVDTSGEENLKVAHADSWAKSRNTTGGSAAEDQFEIETVKNFDWTYSTTYAGTCGQDLQFEEAGQGHEGIPLARLARTDEPILFYDDVVLFEDELHDNGIANLSVKIRVMPSGFFLLARFFLRVDHVLFRIYDVRIYHDFASSEVIRETKGKEAPYEQVKSRLPRERPDDLTPLTDSNWVANALGMLENDRATAARQPAVAAAGTAAPWAAAASASGSPSRQQIAPGVSIPIRTPAPVQQQQAATPLLAQAGGRASQADGGKKAKWKGLGTRLEVASLVEA